MNQSINVVVSLASQVHHQPRSPRAHITPVTRIRLAKTTPSSAVEYARLSHFSEPVARCIRLAMATITIDSIPSHPSGTWK